MVELLDINFETRRAYSIFMAMLAGGCVSAGVIFIVFAALKINLDAYWGFIGFIMMFFGGYLSASVMKAP